MHWRIMMLIILMILSILDLGTTYYYVYKYKKWQPNKPYEQIELNPLLRFLWKKFGFHLGMFIASVIILSLVYIIAKDAHPIVVILYFCIMIWTMFNHWNNVNLLHKLIIKYPSGYLPKEIFGNVTGGN